MDPKIYYLNCPKCEKEYYVSKDLYQIQRKNPDVMLMCPYCQNEFPGKDERRVAKVAIVVRRWNVVVYLSLPQPLILLASPLFRL